MIDKTTGCRILSLWQPWATLIAINLKSYETRPWRTSYRGPIAIHAAKRKMTEAERRVWRWAMQYGFPDAGDQLPQSIPAFEDIPLGGIVAIANLTDCLKMSSGFRDSRHIVVGDVNYLEKWLGDWTPGRIAWKLEEVKPIEFYPFKGAQGLRELPDEVFAELVKD
jgi:activating signal cointegrator 1